MRSLKIILKRSLTQNKFTLFTCDSGPEMGRIPNIFNYCHSAPRNFFFFFFFFATYNKECWCFASGN